MHVSFISYVCRECAISGIIPPFDLADASCQELSNPLKDLGSGPQRTMPGETTCVVLGYIDIYLIICFYIAPLDFWIQGISVWLCDIGHVGRPDYS